ncbi:hypothetical protein GGR55DRAFT_655616 [Xylaria sp. FL0064]|nr:hypothetical protein GGR55DRAFT_655616 [Xylaria sp. FL0064]
MAHRVIQTQDTSGREITTPSMILPYTPGSVYRSEVVGFVRGYVPYIGWIFVAFQEFCRMKYAFGIHIAVMLLLAGT